MFVAKVQDKETGGIKLIKSTEYCKTKTEFRNSLKQYYKIIAIAQI